jgi:hypothetical protein
MSVNVALPRKSVLRCRVCQDLWIWAQNGNTAIKTKSHGTAFAYPVAALTWNNGTRHVLTARFDYGAPDRDVKVRDPSGQEIYPNVFQST